MIQLTSNDNKHVFELHIFYAQYNNLININ